MLDALEHADVWARAMWRSSGDERGPVARGRLLVTVVGVVAAVALQTALACWLTWPLPLHLASHQPQSLFSFDFLYAAWAAAWITHAGAHVPWHLANANIFAGSPDALYYGPPGFGLVPVFAPIFLKTGNPGLALNVAGLASLAMTAIGTQLVAWRWSGSWLAGAIGAAALWSGHGLIDRFVLNPQLTALAPAAVVVFLLARGTHGWASVLALGALGALLMLADLLYVAPGVLLPLGVVVLARAATPASRGDAVRLACSVGLALLLVAPVVAGYARVRAANPALATQTDWAAKTPSLPLRALSIAGYHLGGTRMALVVVALVATGLALRAFGTWRGRMPATAAVAWRHGALWWLSACALVLLLPTALSAAGGADTLVRGPIRLAQCAIVAKGLLVALAFAECTAALRGARVPGVAAAVAVAGVLTVAAWPRLRELAVLPFPIEAALQPRAEEAILRTLPGAAVYLPVPPTLGQMFHAQAMYRSIGFWTPLLNGYASYWPAGFDRRMDLARRLPDPEALAALRRETGLSTVVVTVPYLIPADARRWTALTKAGGAGGLVLAFRTRDTMIFRVRP